MKWFYTTGAIALSALLALGLYPDHWLAMTLTFCGCILAGKLVSDSMWLP